MQSNLRGLLVPFLLLAQSCASGERSPEPSGAGGGGRGGAGGASAGKPGGQGGAFGAPVGGAAGAGGGQSNGGSGDGPAGGKGGDDLAPAGGAGGSVFGTPLADPGGALPTCAPGAGVNSEDLVPTEPGWQARYDALLAEVVAGKDWPIKATNTDADDGKRTWSPLLVNLWQARNDPGARQMLISQHGARILGQKDPGYLWKPFSVPGLLLYYKAYGNELPPGQRETIRSRLDDREPGFGRPHHGGNTGWENLMRPDRKVDPIYPITEFNSENFLWMMRLGGYVFAHDFGDTSRTPFFDTFVKNLVRATFNAGRVEWDSNNYSAWSFHPALVAYDYAASADDKARLKAVLDWMVITTALHYLDGFLVGPDVRAKNNAHERFAGSNWLYSYLYFHDEGFPSFSRKDYIAKASDQLMGFILHTGYKPPQVALDLARRKFTTPVEMHNAKPFYGLDEDSYAAWKGSSPKGRRFEFETLFLHDDYTLGSVATHRPDGNAIFKAANPNFILFSEQRVWALGVRQPSGGALQIFGGPGYLAADGTDQPAGRNPYEETGQYRNVLMRLIDTRDRLWVGVPSLLPVEVGSDVAFANLGSDVYAAWRPLGAKSLVREDDKPGVGDRTQTYTKLTWSFEGLGALVLEVGTKKEHGSYEKFKEAIKMAELRKEAARRVVYKSTLGRVLTMEYSGPKGVYAFHDGTTWMPAGTVPQVWRDGEPVDFETFDAYKVVWGEKIVSQGWGSGTLTASVAGRGVSISVDDTSAKVSACAVGP